MNPLKQYAKEYNLTFNEERPFAYQKAKWLQRNSNIEEVIKASEAIESKDIFLHGCCGVLSCLLDLLFRNNSTQFILLFSYQDEEDINDIRERYKEGNIKYLLILSNNCGFDHVVWRQNGIDYDITDNRSIDDMIESEWLEKHKDIIYSPIELIVDTMEYKSYTMVKFHQYILNGTHPYFSINYLLEGVFNYIRSQKK